MKKNHPWEGYCRSISQEVSCFLCSSKILRRVHTGPLLSHIKVITYLFKLHFNIILPSVSRSSKSCSPFTSSNQIATCTSRGSQAFYIHRQSHIIYLFVIMSELPSKLIAQTEDEVEFKLQNLFKDILCCCSYRCDETMSLNCGHQRAYCSSSM
jgi:hypothetical protein